MNNFVLIILDGVGVGELPDADEFNDSGSNTLGNLSRAVNGLELPNLQGSGLGNIIDISGVSPVSNPNASYGKLAEISKGKDSTTGHWEIAGLFVNTEFSYFPKGFPDETIKTFLNKTGCKNVLGNKAASGTEIIDELGEEHIKTGYPIVYTSADSVFQIAAHEKVIQLDELYKICEITRNEVLIDPVKVGRVIARPFVGEPGNFKRTTNRKDFSIDPPSATLLDVLRQNGIKTIAIGKVNDLFNYRGISELVNTKSNDEGIRKIIEAISQNTNSFIFANLVDFDVYFGHRNDPEGFKKELEKFDKKLPEILNSLDKSDALIITADHGNDPTTPSTDHSREYIPLIFYRKNRSGKDLGTRETFSDIAQTVCSFYKVDNYLKGKSFLDE